MAQTLNNELINNSGTEGLAVFSPELMAATGKVEYPLTNDYMFHIVLEKSEMARKGLCSSILRIPMEDIVSAEVMNPVLHGDNPTNKEYRLDINIRLNGDTLVNLEMQMVLFDNWPDRSLAYTCRNFDNLDVGADYSNLHPVIHVGILKKSCFKNDTRFHSINMLLDIETYQLYSSKFAIHMLCLNQIENASEEDKRWQTDKWAKLLSATSWEEVKDISMGNECLVETSNVFANFNADYWAKKRARDREEYLFEQEKLHQSLAEKDEALAEKDEALAKKDSEIAALKARLAELENSK